MTIQEAIARALERPDMLLCLANRHVIRLGSNSSLLECKFDATRHDQMANFKVRDLLAATWQTYTPEQFMELASQQNQES